MTYPWAAGETLTAADLNSYAGLILVKSVAIGSGVSSVTVTDSFSSDFHSYRILIDSIDTSSTPVIRFQFVSSGGAVFYGNRLQMNNGSTTISNINTGGGGAAYAEIGVGGTTDQGFLSMDVYAPASTKRKGITGNYYGFGYNGNYGYESADGTSRTGFYLTLSTGTFNSGNIRVYGYNNG